MRKEKALGEQAFIFLAEGVVRDLPSWFLKEQTFLAFFSHYFRLFGPPPPSARVQNGVTLSCFFFPAF